MRLVLQTTAETAQVRRKSPAIAYPSVPTSSHAARTTSWRSSAPVLHVSSW